ncbi:MAG TPA: hypothetical protein VGS61_00360 [Acidimicrobiales bacterium]|nr:hypothetical protein [Acidimicrobiales bacterium]
MEGVESVKANNDYYDDVHHRRPGRDTTLCGLKVRGMTVSDEASCPRCRQFARGEF